ncbi:hypothetical protein ABTY61_32365 [Kitasatospora sp. NPDC096128]|uniref:hypothetical protein n=1 Tax=Kitasatospora sp. NPDC096128 TaxID=3155547 RepID=UPI003322B620
MAAEAGAGAETTEAPPNDELAELAPEHLRLLEQLARQRAARQSPAPILAADPATDDGGEIAHLRRYVAVLEAAVAYLLNPHEADR